MNCMSEVKSSLVKMTSLFQSLSASHFSGFRSTHFSFSQNRSAYCNLRPYLLQIPENLNCAMNYAKLTLILHITTSALTEDESDEDSENGGNHKKLKLAVSTSQQTIDKLRYSKEKRDYEKSKATSIREQILTMGMTSH